jgi:hypothetical protein
MELIERSTESCILTVNVLESTLELPAAASIAPYTTVNKKKLSK